MSNTSRPAPIDAARELLNLFLGRDSPCAEPTDSEAVLRALHRAARAVTLPPDVRRLMRAEALMLAGRDGDAAEMWVKLAQHSHTSATVRAMVLARQADVAIQGRRFLEAGTLLNAAGSVWRGGPILHRQEELAKLMGATGAAAKPGRAEAMGGWKRDESTIIETYGLYVSATGPGLLPIQGRIDKKVAGFTVTGSLGTSAREACELAFALWQDRLGEQGVSGIRLHLPNAGIPKDGPSLGLAAYVLVGVVLERLPWPAAMAFTGELDLRGSVLPVGGIDGKVLAAMVGGLQATVIPAANLNDVPAGLPASFRVLGISDVSELERIL